MLEFIMCSFIGTKAVRFVYHNNNIGITNWARDANTQNSVIFFLSVFSSDWNQGLLIAVACSSMLGCFTSSYRRDFCKVNWHIVEYLLRIVNKNILFWAILLHLILWQSMHFMRAFCLFFIIITHSGRLKPRLHVFVINLKSSGESLTAAAS